MSDLFDIETMPRKDQQLVLYRIWEIMVKEGNPMANEIAKVLDRLKFPTRGRFQMGNRVVVVTDDRSRHAPKYLKGQVGTIVGYLRSDPEANIQVSQYMVQFDMDGKTRRTSSIWLEKSL